ncbi:MAG TPA: MetS family NSS transporter small subunit [Candidatus Latescibacteria bacterium]|nr:MetS family NSS transporter small subunit [Candidatus Latescibacterota bacterium]
MPASAWIMFAVSCGVLYGGLIYSLYIATRKR